MVKKSPWGKCLPLVIATGFNAGYKQRRNYVTKVILVKLVILAENRGQPPNFIILPTAQKYWRSWRSWKRRFEVQQLTPQNEQNEVL